MSGTVMTIAKKALYNFDSIGNGTQQFLTIAQRIDVSQYREGRVIARVFNFNRQTATDDIKLIVAPDPYDSDNPDTTFLMDSSDYIVNGALYDSSLSGDPYVKFFDLGTQFGPLLQFLVMGDRTTGSAGQELNSWLSFDLSLKN